MNILIDLNSEHYKFLLFNADLLFCSSSYRASSDLRLMETLSTIFFGIHVSRLYYNIELQNIDTGDPF